MVIDVANWWTSGSHMCLYIIYIHWHWANLKCRAAPVQLWWDQVLLSKMVNQPHPCNWQWFVKKLKSRSHQQICNGVLGSGASEDFDLWQNPRHKNILEPQGWACFCVQTHRSTAHSKLPSYWQKDKDRCIASTILFFHVQSIRTGQQSKRIQVFSVSGHWSYCIVFDFCWHWSSQLLCWQLSQASVSGCFANHPMHWCFICPVVLWRQWIPPSPLPVFYSRLVVWEMWRSHFVCMQKKGVSTDQETSALIQALSWSQYTRQSWCSQESNKPIIFHLNTSSSQFLHFVSQCLIAQFSLKHCVFPLTLDQFCWCIHFPPEFWFWIAANSPLTKASFSLLQSFRVDKTWDCTCLCFVSFVCTLLEIAWWWTTSFNKKKFQLFKCRQRINFIPQREFQQKKNLLKLTGRLLSGLQSTNSHIWWLQIDCSTWIVILRVMLYWCSSKTVAWILWTVRCCICQKLICKMFSLNVWCSWRNQLLPRSFLALWRYLPKETDWRTERWHFLQPAKKVYMDTLFAHFHLNFSAVCSAVFSTAQKHWAINLPHKFETTYSGIPDCLSNCSIEGDGFVFVVHISWDIKYLLQIPAQFSLKQNHWLIKMFCHHNKTEKIVQCVSDKWVNCSLVCQIFPWYKNCFHPFSNSWQFQNLVNISAVKWCIGTLKVVVDRQNLGGWVPYRCDIYSVWSQVIQHTGFIKLQMICKLQTKKNQFAQLWPQHLCVLVPYSSFATNMSVKEEITQEMLPSLHDPPKETVGDQGTVLHQKPLTAQPVAITFTMILWTLLKIKTSEVPEKKDKQQKFVLWAVTCLNGHEIFPRQELRSWPEQNGQSVKQHQNWKM